MNIQSSPDRRWDIDWLRLLVVVGMLVPFHTFRLFDTRDPFYVKNMPQGTVLNWYLILGDTIGMQLLFMLAGAAAWYSLRRASAGRFMWQRVRRLLIPLCTGFVLVVPPQLYLAARFHGFSGSFLDWLPSYFRFDPEQLAGWNGAAWSPAHLWFILYLFVVSLVALPILILLRTPAGRRLATLTAVTHLPGAFFLVPLGLAAALRLLPDFEPNVLYYLIWFLAGYLMLCEPRLEEFLARARVPFLLLGLAGLLLNVLWQAGAVAVLAPIPEWLGEGLRKTFVAWFIIAGLLGYARTYLREAPRSRTTLAAVAYLGEASYPFYILHQTVIVVLGYYVVPSSLPIAVKYLVVVGLTYFFTFALYDLAVRRTNFTRFLFGMKPRPIPERPRQAIA